MAVTIGRGAASVQVEYVRARAVLRLRHLEEARPFGGVVELPLDDLARAFDIGLRAADCPARFLLFGSNSQRRLGGASDLLGVYDEEHEARAAFHAQREAVRRHGWGELVAVEARRPARRVCWFGTAGAVIEPIREPAAPDPSRLNGRSLRSRARSRLRRLPVLRLPST